MFEAESVRIKTTNLATVTEKPTEGQYKRLKKEFIDVEENARKLLTGGKIYPSKLQI